MFFARLRPFKLSSNNDALKLIIQGFKVNKNAAHYSLSMHACGIQNTHLVGQNFIIGSNYDNNKVHLFGFRVYLERERESAKGVGGVEVNVVCIKFFRVCGVEKFALGL